MPRKSYTIEQIINKLREAEVLLSQGQTVGAGHSRAPRFDKLNRNDYEKLDLVIAYLMIIYKKDAVKREAYHRSTGKVLYDEFYPKYSKPIIDEFDKTIGKLMNFDENELDYLINYDIKFRLGSSEEE